MPRHGGFLTKNVDALDNGMLASKPSQPLSTHYVEILASSLCLKLENRLQLNINGLIEKRRTKAKHLLVYLVPF